VDCSPYLCGLGGCRNTCSDDTECIGGGTYCNASNACVAKKSRGDACGRNGECATGACTDGFCCGDLSCLPCYSCGVSGSQGTCTALANGTADTRCTAQAPATCGTTGVCESGACQLYGMATLCSTSCQVTQYVRTYCDGMGTCNQTQTEVCGLPLLLCDANGCL